MIDNATLMIAIAFSSGALMLTLLLGWLNSRRESYLISWAAGMGLVVAALSMLGLRGDSYGASVILVPFAALLSGLALIHVGTRQFRLGVAHPLSSALLWIATISATTLPLMFGLTGLSTIMLNIGCALYMVLSGYQYWAGRNEARLPLVSGAVLFVLTGLSFLACAIQLLIDGRMVLTAPPSNWAEELNSIMAIVGLTGIGALSLTLNQSRAARRHRLDAQTDALSGLMNRRALFGRFETSELRPGTAVLMFDIDHFKQINDRQGHAAGDAVIQHFADVLRRNMRPGDVVARIGGEEFCAILDPMSADSAKSVAERIRTDFESSPARLLAEVIPATVSVGVAIGGADEAFSSILSRADAALYKAKDSGRNRVTSASFRLIA